MPTLQLETSISTRQVSFVEKVLKSIMRVVVPYRRLSIRHNKLRDMKDDLLNKESNNVQIEPTLQPLSVMRYGIVM